LLERTGAEIFIRKATFESAAFCEPLELTRSQNVSIKTIYTVGYLQIFNAGHFFSSKHCHDLQSKKHWLAMVFNETTNFDFILLSKQGRTQLKYSTEHVFENFEEDLPGCSPLIAG